MNSEPATKVAIIGGGCASITTAFELSRPEHRGRFDITVYQVGWRLGGKGASGRGPSGRIEEHGLHVWLGFYENAFRLLRECYAELAADPGGFDVGDWRDAFVTDNATGLSARSQDGSWHNWSVCFPARDGLPGDPISGAELFSVRSYVSGALDMLGALLQTVDSRRSEREAGEPGFLGREPPLSAASMAGDPQRILSAISDLVGGAFAATTAVMTEALAVLEAGLQMLPSPLSNPLTNLAEWIAHSLRQQLEKRLITEPYFQHVWEMMDVVVASVVGILRFNLLTDPRGFDAIDDYELREWLRLNGASERSLDSALMRGIYDLAFAYQDADPKRPNQSAGCAIRGSMRMFFTYRGAFFWRMQAAMGDVVFAPFYQVLKRRGVTFKFFHRLTRMKLADPSALAPGERHYVDALEFDVQALTRDGHEYQPLIDVRGLPCWPSRPDYSQLVGGDRMRWEGRDFESHWERRKAATRTLRVGADFDFVVLGVGLGALPEVARDLIDRDQRWRDLVSHVTTVATQAFQIWMREDLPALGGPQRQTAVSAFYHPFDTCADMRHLITEESWPVRPRAIAYFCSALPDAQSNGASPDHSKDHSADHSMDGATTDGMTPNRAADYAAPNCASDYPARQRERVRRNAIDFLNRDIKYLWPNAARPDGGFRWDLLMTTDEAAHSNGYSAPAAGEAAANSSGPAPAATESRFETQFWTANVNPSDRYAQSPPKTNGFRISPLDNTYDNLTVAGDWTACGLNVGCVEAAVMSGRLAAHALAGAPALEEIVGYDHP